MMRYDFLLEASQILAESDDSVTLNDVRAILEDTTSPIATKHIDNLYEQIIKKTHIDFDNIPESKGNIKKYSGYQSMVDTLTTMKSLTDAGQVRDAMDCVQIVTDAISNIASLEDLYEKGFLEKNDHVIIEYNTLVYTCVEATSTLLSQYVEFVKGFNLDSFQIRIRNTKYKANRFFIDQLDKYNNIVRSSNYRNYLSAILSGDRSNFVGATAIGVGAVAITVAMAIVPVTRSIVYNVFKMRTKLSDALALQAYFLELNKACVEANREFDSKRKEKILKKQENIRVLFMKLSDKLKVDTARSERDGAIALKKDNSTLTVGETKKQVDNSSFDFLL